MVPARFDPAGPLRGTLVPPADKSISHRAALIAAMGTGQTRISNFLYARDTEATEAALSAQQLGADVKRDRSEGVVELRIQGVGLRGSGVGPWPKRIDVGNAGTLLRLLPGWLAGCDGGPWELFGDDSISRRPVDRVVEPLRRMGANITCRKGGVPPLSIQGGELAGIEYELPVASAQVKSCVLFAGLNAGGETTVIEPVSTRDHTERMLTAAGVDVRIEPSGGGRRITVEQAKRIEPPDIEIPGDFSSAAFFVVAVLIVPGSEIKLSGVGLNPTRTGLLSILERMGAAIEAEREGEQGGEPVGSIVARHSPLGGTEVGSGEVPLAIDELPLVALAGCFAEGETVVRGAGELRHKESDRIAAVVEGLRGLGAEIEGLPDGLAVSGTGGLQGGTLQARGDHRMAMLGAIAGLASREGVSVEGFDAAAVSYPGFEADLRSLTDR